MLGKNVTRQKAMPRRGQQRSREISGWLLCRTACRGQSMSVFVIFFGVQKTLSVVA
jgi:hypothetical protein